MSIRRKGIVFLCGIVVGGGLASALWMGGPDGEGESMAHRRACRANMLALAKAMKVYSMDHGESYPANVAEMAPYCDNPRILVCPATRTQLTAKRVAELDDWVDYVYVAWSSGENTPSDYPLLYDGKISNHGGRGINIVLFDGVAFWDEGAEWLKGFCAAHPKEGILLPDGVQ